MPRKYIDNCTIKIIFYANQKIIFLIWQPNGLSEDFCLLFLKSKFFHKTY